MGHSQIRLRLPLMTGPVTRGLLGCHLLLAWLAPSFNCNGRHLHGQSLFYSTFGTSSLKSYLSVIGWPAAFSQTSFDLYSIWSRSLICRAPLAERQHTVCQVYTTIESFAFECICKYVREISIMIEGERERLREIERGWQIVITEWIKQ